MQVSFLVPLTLILQSALLGQMRSDKILRSHSPVAVSIGQVKKSYCFFMTVYLFQFPVSLSSLWTGNISQKINTSPDVRIPSS